MIKATLDLNTTALFNYQHIDLERNWRTVTVICIWLKVRKFDLALPVFVTKDDSKNTLTFFQTKTDSGKTVIIVNPNREVLSQLSGSLKKEGHTIYTYTNVSEANIQLFTMSENGMKLNTIIIPKDLKISHSLTYKNYLNMVYPNLKVLTVETGCTKDFINLNISRKEYINSLIFKDRQIKRKAYLNQQELPKMIKVIQSIKRDRYKAQQFNLNFISMYSYLFDDLFSSDQSNKKHIWKQLKARASVHNFKLNLGATKALWKEYNHAR